MALQPKGHVRESDLFFPPALTKRKLSFSEKPDARLRAYVRLRPLPTTEKHTDIHTTDTHCTIKLPKSSAQGALQNEEHTFAFDRVFDAHAAQRDVYEAAVLPQVNSLLEGRDSLTFAYGITNAGKTYTVQGVDTPAGQGMLPRALNDVFAALAAQRAKMEPPPSALDPRAKYALRASFLEVYGNDAFDLLAPPERSFFGGEKTRRVLKIKEGKGGVTVESLKEVELPDLETALATVRAGWKARQSASNGVNDSSSRSHAVLCLKLLHTAPGARKPTETRLYIVDLAGAERQKNTQSTGARLAEASHINNDLMVLGHCLRDLRWNQSHPKSNQRLAPFRSSRISMLFRDFLSGVGQTVVIAAINPRATDASSTLETLRFASVAQQIKTVALMPPPPPLGRAASVRKAGKPPVAAAAQDENNVHASNRTSVATVDDAVVVALQGQVFALRERLMEVEAERMADERRIREEVSAEMHKHLEETEEVMMQRLEEAQYETEEAYQKKLMLVKSAHKDKSSRKEAQSHDDMMQVHRLSQRKESASLARICELQSELQAARRDTARVTAELATALRSPERNGAPTPRTAAELNDAKARVAELQLAVAEASDARAAAEREQASAAAAADESRIMLVRAQASEEAAHDQLKTEKFEASRAVELAKAADKARLEAEAARDEALEALEKMTVDAESARSLLSTEQEANGAFRAELEAEKEANGVLRAELDAVREQLAAEASSHDSSRSHLEETLCNLRLELAAYKAPVAYAPAPGGAVVAAAEPSPRVQTSYNLQTFSSKSLTSR